MSMRLLEMIWNNGAATGSYKNFIKDAVDSGKHPAFDLENVRSGDIFFIRVGHACLVVGNGTYIHSTDTADFHGVKIDSLFESKSRKVAFRLNTPNAKDIAQEAGLLVGNWLQDGQDAQNGRGKVGYSDFHPPGMGLGFRGLMSAIGPSTFGRGARGRLQKYKGREGMRPKNAFCSEMCILAYQLVMAETEPGFINLDAKYTTPSKLLDWFRESPHWEIAWAGTEYVL